VQSLAIGNTAGGGNKFIGAIDDVRLWNVVRSENEIKNSSAIELKGNESGLVGNWRFNNDLLDNSVNQNNGTEVKTTNSLAYITGAVDSSSQSAFGIRLNSKPAANVTVTISDITGKVVKQINFISKVGTNGMFIETSNLHNGIYFVQVESNNVKSTNKIVVKH
jgi:hypothetical protein